MTSCGLKCWVAVPLKEKLMVRRALRAWMEKKGLPCQEQLYLPDCEHCRIMLVDWGGTGKQGGGTGKQA